MRFILVGLLVLLGHPSVVSSQDQKAIDVAPASAGCSLFDSPSGVHSAVDDAGDIRNSRLLAIYNAQARLVRSMKAVAVIHATRGPKFGARAGTSRPISGFFDFEQPAALRVTGVVPPVGKKVFDLASDGREFHLLALDHEVMKLYVGLVDSQPNMLQISVPEIGDIARPREILDALRWQEGTLRKTQASSAAQNDTLEFDLPPRAGRSITGTLKFDSQSGAISSLQIQDAEGELISEVFYADWQTLAETPGGASKACFPRRVRLVQPMEDIQLDFRFLEMTLNPRTSRGNFHVSPAPGTPVIHLSPAGVGKAH